MIKKIWWAIPEFIREFVIRATPRRLGRFPYWVSYFFLRIDLWIHFRRQVEVWPRHSFVLGAHQPFRSDLDLTIWSSGPFSVDEVGRLNSVLARTRWLFPWVSECNFYEAAKAVDFVTAMNFFEYARDPFLGLKNLNECSDLSLRTQAAAFLFRVLESDWQNLQQRPWVREGKWRQHLKVMRKFKNREVDRALSEDLSPSRVIECIVSLAGFTEEKSPKICSDLEEYYDRRSKGLESPEGISPHVRWYFLPHRFSYFGEPPADRGRAGWDLFLAQISWEVWGLNTQINWLEKTSLQEHLRHLQSAIARAPQEPEQKPVVERLKRQLSELQIRLS